MRDCRSEVRDVRRNGEGRGLCGGQEKEWMVFFLDDGNINIISSQDE